MLPTHRRVNAFYIYLILQGDRQSMECTHRLAVHKEVLITFFGTFKCTLNEYFCQAICLLQKINDEVDCTCTYIIIRSLPLDER